MEREHTRVQEAAAAPELRRWGSANWLEGADYEIFLFFFH